MVAPVGVVFWARVSPEVDQRLTERIATEPVRLQPPEWRSGPIIWIVDAVGEHKVVEAMLTRLLETEWKGQEVRLRAHSKDGGYKVGVLGRGPRTASSKELNGAETLPATAPITVCLRRAHNPLVSVGRTIRRKTIDPRR